MKKRFERMAYYLSREAEQTPHGEEYVGNPETHGIDEPRGGGFSIMQDLQEDLRKEQKKVYASLKSRRAMYWGGPDRTYRLTREEQESGAAICPKCKGQMEKEPFMRGEKLYMCPECRFKVPTSKTTTTRIQIDVEPNGEIDVDVTNASRRGRNASMILADDFNAALDKFLEHCRKVLSDYMEKTYPTLPKEELKTQEGQRYVKVVKTDGVSTRSAWAFVDKTNGDVLKAASWGVPAKHARASIYDPSTWKNVGPYGPAYMRGM